MVYVIRRLLQAVFLALVMSFLVFTGIFAVGNPVDILIDPEATQAERVRLIAQLGLDRPFHEQYFIFLGNVLQGDFGNSFVYNRPALGLILERMPATLELAFAAIVIAVVLGIPLGMYAGLRPGTPGSQAVMAGSILGFSVPNFWQAIMLIMIFAVVLGWFPVSGRGQVGEFLGIRSSLFTLNGLQHMALPAVNLGIGHRASGAGDPACAVGHAGGQGAGFHSLCPRQGPERAAHRAGASAAQHPDPDCDSGRYVLWRADRLCRGERIDLRMARNGQADHRLDPPVGPACRGRLSDRDCRDLHHPEPAG